MPEINDVNAEMALLGGVMAAPDKTVNGFLAVPPDAYYFPKHQVLAGLIQDMLAKSIPVDPMTVLQQVMDQGILSKVGGAPYLHSLLQFGRFPDHTGYYAEWVLELHGRRLLWGELTRETQRLEQLGETGERSGVAEAVARLRATLDAVTSFSLGGRAEAVVSLEEFLQQVNEYDWLVPGLFERRDRLMITGDEGGGKSMLIWQLACAMAAGLHPFTSAGLPGGPCRVAIFDCENSPGQSRRRGQGMVNRMNLMRDTNGLTPIDWTKQMMVEFRTDGLNLLAAHDVAYLERWVAACQPDVLVIGPLYKLHHDDMNSEQVARSLVAVLDNIRARHDCMIITEAHAGNGTDREGNRMMRPRGSSLFLGWPEFGFGLRRVKEGRERWPGQMDLVPWRGQREARAFPEQIYRGHELVMPWRPTPEYFDQPDPDWDGS